MSDISSSSSLFPSPLPCTEKKGGEEQHLPPPPPSFPDVHFWGREEEEGGGHVSFKTTLPVPPPSSLPPSQCNYGSDPPAKRPSQQYLVRGSLPVCAPPPFFASRPRLTRFFPPPPLGPLFHPKRPLVICEILPGPSLSSVFSVGHRIRVRPNMMRYVISLPTHPPPPQKAMEDEEEDEVAWSSSTRKKAKRKEGGPRLSCSPNFFASMSSRRCHRKRIHRSIMRFLLGLRTRCKHQVSADSKDYSFHFQTFFCESRSGRRE